LFNKLWPLRSLCPGDGTPTLVGSGGCFAAAG